MQDKIGKNDTAECCKMNGALSVLPISLKVWAEIFVWKYFVHFGLEYLKALNVHYVPSVHICASLAEFSTAMASVGATLGGLSDHWRAMKERDFQLRRLKHPTTSPRV